MEDVSTFREHEQVLSAIEKLPNNNIAPQLMGGRQALCSVTFRGRGPLTTAVSPSESWPHPPSSALSDTNCDENLLWGSKPG